MYNDAARALRICTATRTNGEPCRAWALWDDPLQRCVRHARGGRGKALRERVSWSKTRYTPCTCIAYAWPHRPGSGLCCWPDPPRYRLTTPAGTHDWPRLRGGLAIYAVLRRRWRQK